MKVADIVEATKTEACILVRPPDGGFGWLVVFSAMLYTVIIFGFHNSFGVYLLALLEFYKETNSFTAGAGSLSYGLIMIFGPLSGKLIQRFGAKVVSIIGSVIVIISVIGSSFAPSIEIFYLTHGILTGIGSSLAVTTGMIMISRYFTTKRSFATGIVMAGGALGTLVQSQMHRYLIEIMGWKNSMRVYCGIVAPLIVAACAFRPLPGTPPSIVQNFKTSPLKGFIVDLALWKNKIFITWVCANGLLKFGFFIPYVHLIKHASDFGISLTDGSNLMITLGVSCLVGRIIFGKICDSKRINRLYANQASMFIVGLLYLIVPACKNFASLITFAFFLGLADSGNYVLLPVLTFDLMGAERMPVAWGFMMAVNAVSCLGPPFAGWIHDMTGSYDIGFIVPGVCSIIASFVLAILPCLKRNTKQSGTTLINIPYCEETQELLPFESTNPTHEVLESEGSNLNIVKNQERSSTLIVKPVDNTQSIAE
ncbi:monocarboxylate transporter 10-like isoform X2 [Lissotriton helveticus]